MNSINPNLRINVPALTLSTPELLIAPAIQNNPRLLASLTRSLLPFHPLLVTSLAFWTLKNQLLPFLILEPEKT